MMSCNWIPNSGDMGITTSPRGSPSTDVVTELIKESLRRGQFLGSSSVNFKRIDKLDANLVAVVNVPPAVLAAAASLETVTVTILGLSVAVLNTMVFAALADEILRISGAGIYTCLPQLCSETW